MTAALRAMAYAGAKAGTALCPDRDATVTIDVRMAIGEVVSGESGASFG